MARALADSIASGWDLNDQVECDIQWWKKISETGMSSEVPKWIAVCLPEVGTAGNTT
jgi:hypothetical protein